MKNISCAVALILFCINVSFSMESTLFDANESGATGTVWPGQTWWDEKQVDTNSLQTGASGYGAAGWRSNNGHYYSGNTNWLDRTHEKTDYGNSNLAIIDTSERAPGTNSGGSLRIYDDNTSNIYQSCWWFLYGNNFGTQGKADAFTNRMSFYFKPSGITDDPQMTGDIENGNIHIGTYLCWENGAPGGEGCPKEASDQHYYHYLTVNSNAWLHVLLDRHPTHQRGMSGADEPDDNPVPAHNYFEAMNSLYVEIRYPQQSPTAYNIDEVALYTTSQPENDISIASLWVGYWSDTDKWEIGFNDNSFNDAGYNNDSQSTFEVRYSTSPITNENYSQATIAEPEYWERGTTNTFHRPNAWKKPVWTRFSLPDAIETSSEKIYFAIKDVSSISNNDGHNAPSSLIHTIDYSLPAAKKPMPATNLIVVK